MNQFIMTSLIFFLIFTFILAIFFAYKNDVKLKRARLSDFYNPIIYGIAFIILVKFSKAIQNYSIDQDKYLTKFNNTRVQCGLLPIDSAQMNYTRLFKNWTDYFSGVKKDYTFEITPKKIELSRFESKYIYVKNNKISFEEDTYKLKDRAIKVSYNFNDSSLKYTILKYEYLENGRWNSSDERTLNRQQCLDTLKEWKMKSLQ